jgi:hypothetical protein
MVFVLNGYLILDSLSVMACSTKAVMVMPVAFLRSFIWVNKSFDTFTLSFILRYYYFLPPPPNIIFAFGLIAWGLGG